MEPEIARDAIYVPPPIIEPIRDTNGGPVIVPPPFPPPSLPVSKSNKRYSLSATVDKQKAFRLFRALQNLIDNSSRLQVRIEVEAESDAGFNAVWLRNAVEEPLDEADIDAQTSLQ